MDNPETKKQQPEDAAVKACGDVLVEQMKAAGFTEHLLLGARQTEDGQQYDLFARSDCSTTCMANMLLFVMNRMNDESVGKLMNWLLSQPAVASKMVSFQAQQMARHAETLKQQAAASPQEPAPSVPETKNKSWLN